jgi:hypothetical protein
MHRRHLSAPYFRRKVQLEASRLRRRKGANKSVRSIRNPEKRASPAEWAVSENNLLEFHFLNENHETR